MTITNSDGVIRRVRCTHCRERVPSASLEAHLRQVHGLRVDGGRVLAIPASTFQANPESSSSGQGSADLENTSFEPLQPQDKGERPTENEAIEGNDAPPTVRAWSLGTTILPQGGMRCVCAFDANGNVYYKALTVGGREDVPPGTALSRKRGTDFKTTGGGVESGWAEAARRMATVWTVEPMTRREPDGREFGQWCTSSVYSAVLEWYPDGKHTPVAPSGVPRRPGCWEEAFRRIDGTMPARSTRIVELGFDLLREDDLDGYVYRSQLDARFRATWIVKYNGREGIAPPEHLPKGTVVGVFLAIGHKKSRRWNPVAKKTEKFAYLKIGSVLSVPASAEQHWADREPPARELPTGAVRPYAQSDQYSVGDIIRHPTFGDGEVRQVISRTRMAVLFGNELVTLAQGRP